MHTPRNPAISGCTGDERVNKNRCPKFKHFHGTGLKRKREREKEGNAIWTSLMILPSFQVGIGTAVLTISLCVFVCFLSLHVVSQLSVSNSSIITHRLKDRQLLGSLTVGLSRD